MTQPTLIDGKAIAQKTKDFVKEKVDKLKAQGKRAPGLAVVLVGENPASQVYVGHKKRSCDYVGFISEEHALPSDTQEADILALIDDLNHADHIDGILVQLPLPKHINSEKIIEHISPLKDVDGFHPYNFGRLSQATPTLRPCTPYGVMKLLEAYNIDPAGKDAVILGKSNIVGRPMALELLMANATVTICHSKTQDLAKKVNHADIVVAGVGIPNFVKGEWIKQDAVVIDVGINRLDTGKLCGDTEFDSCKAKASHITPVPGGVGPMTVAMLMQNTLEAYLARQENI